MVTDSPPDKPDRHARIIDATTDLLGRGGLAAVSMRAVAREAGVSLGLVNYHYSDKTSLLKAALLRVEEQDLAILAVDSERLPEEQLRTALRRAVEPAYLTTDYLSLRLQLWALARAEAEFAKINADAQRKYRRRLTELIAAARPDLARDECRRRAADIDVLQNGVWLTVLLGLDRASVVRSLRRCEEIALG